MRPGRGVNDRRLGLGKQGVLREDEEKQGNSCIIFCHTVRGNMYL